MTDGQPEGAAPEAPWSAPGTETGSPQQPQPGLKPGDQIPQDGPPVALQPGETQTPGGIVMPGQQPQPPPEQEPEQIPTGPWNEFACHRSWLMGARPAQRATPRIDPRSGQIDPTSMNEIVMLPVPSPYACIGPKCSLWNEPREKCTEVALMEAQLEQAEAQPVVKTSEPEAEDAE